MQTQLENKIQQLTALQEKLRLLNPDDNVEYCEIRPSLAKSIGRATLAAGSTGGVMALSWSIAFLPIGLPAAIIAMLGSAAYYLNEKRATHITYESSIEITTTRIKPIPVESSLLLPNENYIVQSKGYCGSK